MKALSFACFIVVFAERI